MGDLRSCLHFTLGNDGFAIPLDAVREILPAAAICEVPLAPPSIRGLLNIRGRVVTLIDIARIHDRALPEVQVPEDRLACLLTPPRDHLALYLHAPVEIAAAEEVTAAARKDAVGSHTVAASGRVLHLVSIESILQRCREDIIACYRRAEGARA